MSIMNPPTSSPASASQSTPSSPKSARASPASAAASSRPASAMPSATTSPMSPPRSPAASSASPARPPASSAAPAAMSPAASARAPPARWSPRITPPTAKPPTAATAPTPRATFAAVLCSVCLACTSSTDSPAAGTGTAIFCPTFAVGGTFTCSFWPGLFGSSISMVVPGPPGGTVITTIGPAGRRGFAGAFIPRGGRIFRSLSVPKFFCTMLVKLYS
mmetsp:Transcript_32858/g.90762  ORF Transcript_32858/g.90762 Transcript_32858/m.90762 type:complete len:218 (+) Transcript_32858:77-730(+)